MYIERVQRPGIPPQVDKAHLRRAICQANGLGELLPLAVKLSQETEAIMNNRKLSESDVHRIAVPLAKIRLLLTTIAPRGRGPNEFFSENALVRDLVDRYLDIEGRIKEMRNDLARAKTPRVP
jgi:hypothetical protein